jgi:hypothetical protein
MGNTDSTENMFVDPQTTVMVSRSRNETVPMIPTDDYVQTRHKDYGNVEKVLIVTYHYPDGELPSISDAKLAVEQGRSIAGGFSVLLQDMWSTRNKRAEVKIIAATNHTALAKELAGLGVDDRLLIVADATTQVSQIVNGRSIREPVLFGPSGRHTSKEITDLLGAVLKRKDTTIMNCMSVTIYYLGNPQPFAVDVLQGLAKEDSYICIRCVCRTQPFDCTLYFNKLALRQFKPCH